MSRNPSLSKQLFGYAILGFALSEAMALFALLVAFLILFALATGVWPPTRSTQSVRLTLARTELEIQSIQANRANQPGQTNGGQSSQSVPTWLVMLSVITPSV